MPSKTEVFTPCCTLPEKVQALCCGCTSYTWQWWEITEIDQFTDAGCWAEDLNGVSYYLPVTQGCGLNNSSALRFLGPSPAIGAWSPTQLKCNWMSWPYVWEIFGGGGDPYYGGHGSPPSSEFFGCCFPDLTPVLRCQKRMGWQMGCIPGGPSEYIPAQTAWISPDCTECDDGLWCDDSHDIEYGSLEDCQTYSPNPEQCKCCQDEVVQQFATSQLCHEFGCTSCTEIITVEHQYTPPFPDLWYLSWFGPCGCGGPVYISTTSEHPLYAFYQPTSGLDNLDHCGNYFYRNYGALDATGPFDCTSGGRFVLFNFVQNYVQLDGTPCSDVNPCNIATNVFNGHDPVCAAECNGYNFTDCHAGCTTHGIYAEVRPIPSERVLPHSNWIPPDPYGNPLCCERSSDGSSDSSDGMGMALAMGEAMMEAMPDDALRFTYGVFRGAMVQTSENSWKVNYPPLSFELTKESDRYSVDGIEANVLLADPLMLSVEIRGVTLEVYGR